MQTIQGWLRAQPQLINQFNQPINQSDLRRLLGFLLQRDTAWLFSHPDHVLLKTEVEQLNHWVDQLIKGYPLAYIVGQQQFWDLDLMVNEHTLIPRADSETIIETALNLFPNKHPQNILDLGTGSGALALALAKVFPDAQIIGVDQSIDALTVARHNAKINHIQNVCFIQSNWFDNVKPTAYELIVSNPPYIDENDAHLDALSHEPRSALVADENGLGDIIRITVNATQFLAPDGILMFEHGWQQKLAVHEIMKDAGYQDIVTAQDLAGQNRVTYGTRCH